MSIQPKNPDFNIYNLPLFSWGKTNHQKPLSYPALYLKGKYKLSPTRAALIADLMGLEAANDR